MSVRTREPDEWDSLGSKDPSGPRGSDVSWSPTHCPSASCSPSRYGGGCGRGSVASGSSTARACAAARAGRYPVAYFPLAEVVSGVLLDTEPITPHRDLGMPGLVPVRAGDQTTGRARDRTSSCPPYAASWRVGSRSPGGHGRLLRGGRAHRRPRRRPLPPHRHPPDLPPPRRPCRDRVIADTTRPWSCTSPGSRPAGTSPRRHRRVRADPVDGQTFCPYKGPARLRHRGPHKAAWSYPEAWPQAGRISDSSPRA